VDQCSPATAVMTADDTSGRQEPKHCRHGLAGGPAPAGGPLPRYRGRLRLPRRKTVTVADWIPAVVALAAVIVAFAAFVRSGRATTAAEESAQASRDSADEARRVANLEIQREHERLAPTVDVTFRINGGTVFADVVNQTGRTYVVTLGSGRPTVLGWAR